MRRRTAAALGLLGALAACGLLGRRPPPPAPAHYTLGAPYQLGGVWYYPKDLTQYAATGLAAVAPDKPGLTADGERFDQTALAASHQTLQLPAIARVTNLENGRSVLVRLNDRGPADPGRLLGLTRHAAALLGAADGTQIRVELDADLSRALTDQVGGGPRLDVAAAPQAAVVSEQLAPPPGVRQSSRGSPAANAPAAPAGSAAPVASVPDRLPDQVEQGPPAPGQIILRAQRVRPRGLCQPPGRPARRPGRLGRADSGRPVRTLPGARGPVRRRGAGRRGAGPGAARGGNRFPAGGGIGAAR